MARLFTCGFEENNLTATMWNATNATPTIVTTPVHSGTYSCQIDANDIVYKTIAAQTSGSYYTRMYFRFSAFPITGDHDMLSGLNNGESAYNWRVLFRVTDNHLRLYNSATSVDYPHATALSTDTWYRVEIKHIVSNTVGELKLRLFDDNGTELGAEVGAAGIDTIGSGADQGMWRFGGDTDHSQTMYIDDIAINDDQGSFQNSYPIGAGKIGLAIPGGNVTNDWEDETAGSSTFNNIDDLPGTPNDADYNVETASLNSVDQFTLATLPADIPSNADVILIDVYARVGSDQVSAATGRMKIWDESNSLTNGPNVSFAVSGWRIMTMGPTAEHQVLDLGTRTKANVQDFDIGYDNITDDATRDRRVSALWANVEWIEASVNPPDDPYLGLRSVIGAPMFGGAG